MVGRVSRNPPAILDPEQAMAMACLSKQYKLEAVGTPFGVSYATLDSAVKSPEQRQFRRQRQFQFRGQYTYQFRGQYT